MRLDDGPRDRQPEPHAARLGGEERVEELRRVLRGDAAAAVANGDRAAARSLVDRQDDGPSVLGQLVDGIHRVEQQDDEDLLDLRRIADEIYRCRREAEIDRHLPLPSFGAQQRRGVAERRVEVELLPLRLVLGEERTQAADDVGRAQVVAADSRHDAQEVFAAIASRLQDQVGGIGAGLHGAERLVDLVRDRRRQLAGHGEPRRVRELHALLLDGELGGATAATLEEQRRDHRGLDEDDGGRDDRRVAIHLPERRLPIVDDGVGRHRMLVDAPAANLAPVDLQRGRRDLGKVERGGRRPGEQLVDGPASLAAHVLEARHATADDADADEAVERTVDGRPRRRGDQRRRLARTEYPSIRIQVIPRREHDGIGVELGHALLHRRGRQARQELDRHVARDRRHLAPQPRFPAAIALPAPVTITSRRAPGCQRRACAIVPAKSYSIGTPTTSAGSVRDRLAHVLLTEGSRSVCLEERVVSRSDRRALSAVAPASASAVTAVAMEVAPVAVAVASISASPWVSV